MDLESTPIYQYAAPTSARLQPLKSTKPILTPGYELRPCLINMVQDQPFWMKMMKTPIPTLAVSSMLLLSNFDCEVGIS